MAAQSLVSKVEEFVRAELAGQDLSHDYAHIERVRTLSLELAHEEGVSGDNLEVVELAALLHDIRDWKYSGSESAGQDAAREFLTAQCVPEGKIARVCRIIDGVSFKNELGRPVCGDESNPGRNKELFVVQDADRLDAIGAVGIARTFAYAGHKGHPMMRPGDENLTVHMLSRRIQKPLQRQPIECAPFLRETSSTRITHENRSRA
eukprot:1059467_1